MARSLPYNAVVALSLSAPLAFGQAYFELTSARGCQSSTAAAAGPAPILPSGVDASRSDDIHFGGSQCVFALDRNNVIERDAGPVSRGSSSDGSPTSGESPATALAARARRQMAENLATLPNYTCQETIERSIRQKTSQKLLFRDRIHLEVAFLEANDMFSWPGATGFRPDLLNEIPQIGASGAGNFGGWIRTVFGPSSPEFAYVGECKLEGRRASRFTFHVPTQSSAYHVDSGGSDTVLPFSGSLCVDPNSADVVLLEIRAEQTPPPIAAISELIQYARRRIGSSEFLLPQNHELTVTDFGGNENRNIARFTACREYSSESSISFDVKQAAAPYAGTIVEEMKIPAGVLLELKLETPIRYEDSAVGDPITARLAHALKVSGVSIPKGAIVSGRIRELEQYFEPEKYFQVSLEFSSVAFGHKRALFQARLIGPRLHMRKRLDSSGMAMESAATLPDSALEERSGFDLDDSSPHFGAFRIHGGNLRLDTGLRMILETGTPYR